MLRNVGQRVHFHFQENVVIIAIVVVELGALALEQRRVLENGVAVVVVELDGVVDLVEV